MTQSSAELKEKLREVDHEIEEVLKREVRSGRLEAVDVARISAPIVTTIYLTY
ncbi:hypothetical protein J2W57_003410 [Chryseobacterium ginsenosidimutans]|uniref:Uncharacterized protein n=1 Tax=Chryseobacterium geocarposphaerae TaxID=1416776 RepID=A0ABU1LC87_9FLAO|nr:hypothetical protein [Chryseobacterium geocarposphaerae]MDR6700005.1 hypothetical protein [Chryseobacterium ginsenosidimutans]